MTDVSSEPTGRGISVSIKYSGARDATWAVFHGLPAEVREDVIEFYGLDRESVADLSLSSVVVNATQLAHGKGVAAVKLGGVVIGDGPTEDVPPHFQQGATSEPAQPAVNPILARIEAVDSTEALQRLWAENQAAFADPDVMAAYKVKGKALTTGAAS